MDHLGTKANLPDLLACFLPDQITSIDRKLSEREQVADKYESAFKETKIRLPKIKSGITHSRHLFPIHVGADNRDRALLVLGDAKIGATVNYRAVTSMSFYKKKYGFSDTDFPVSQEWGSGTLSIPLFPGITDAEQKFVITVLLENIEAQIGEK
jgi:UDP-4-amino-4-deoxy-L-arabinose-oxoglutarate aminotransferase